MSCWPWKSEIRCAVRAVERWEDCGAGGSCDDLHFQAYSTHFRKNDAGIKMDMESKHLSREREKHMIVIIGKKYNLVEGL